jgi:hypothetical protein
MASRWAQDSPAGPAPTTARPCKGLLAGRKQVIGCEALQPAYFNGFFFSGIFYTDLLA